MTSEFIVPTGRIIREYLDTQGINQKELSIRTGVSEKHISHVLNSSSRLTEDFALKIEKVLVGISASYLLNYEAKYRENIARYEEITKLSNLNLKEIARKFHFKEVYHGLDLPLLDQAVEMLKLLKISAFENFELAYGNLSCDFMQDGGEKAAIAVWLNLCEQEIEVQNNEIDEICYDKTSLISSMNIFKMIAYNEDLEKSIESCRKLCNKLGIYLVFCDAIKNCKVRGALTTFNHHPTIMLSGRFKKHDHIWFAIVHELGHLILHYNKNDIIISYEDSEDCDAVKEQEANAFARDFFLNPKDYLIFVRESQFTEERIRKFAKSQSVLPGIVVARLQHDEILPYDKMNSLRT